MSHDEMSGPVTRKERRKAFGGKRQAAPRYVFTPSAYVRPDWNPEDLIEVMEDRARGYNGVLRQVLCTAAAMVRDAVSEDLLKTQETGEVVNSTMRGEKDPIMPSNITPGLKRNQQPGRLSGGEREALKKFVTLVVSVGSNDDLMNEVMADGRALLTKVRKRALGSNAEETVDCSALMPVGVEDPPAEVPARTP